ncbi:MAG: SDR family NAD(P)-dependent oxidoreductase [Clostridiaceae bacterium]|nr:SDR family NAD(P)-dependent oxidoreductase [Clostridiaceae bacterium]
MYTIVITGASSGIGLETARVLTQKGFNVLGVARNEANCNRAKDMILSENPNAKISFFVADLMQQREVIRVAEEITSYLDQKCSGKLFALINNAGCVRSWYMTTEEGYEQQFALNHLAGFLLTYKLLPALEKARGRIIMTGSESHKGIKVNWDDVMLSHRYNPLTAYKQSKLCNILFAKGLNDRYASAGIRAYVVDPGLVNTDIGNKETGGLVNLIWMLRKRHGVSPTIPAKTYGYLCEQETAPDGLYYYLCKEKIYSKQVTSKNANRLFELSERLCGIYFGKVEMK